MTLVEALTLIALLLGPIFGSAIAIWLQNRSARMERRFVILRQLVAARYMPADPSFHVAMNMIPIEFSDSLGVLEAWRTYMDAANRAALKPEHTDLMIRAVMKALRYKESQVGDVVRGGYFSVGLGNQQQAVANALGGVPKIADELKRIADGLLALRGGPSNDR